MDDRSRHEGGTARRRVATLSATAHFAVTKASLSPAYRRLVELMQTINFGRIEGLVVAGGEPVLDPPPRVVREVKFGGDNRPRPERGAADFELKFQVVELFAQLAELGDAAVESIEIKHGLPFRMTFEAPATA